MITPADIRSLMSVDDARPAIMDSLGHVTSYKYLLRYADEFRHNLGGTRRLVFLEASNTIEAISAYIGCVLGGHPVYVFARQDTDTISSLVERYRPSVILRPGQSNPCDWLNSSARRFHPDLSVLLSTSGSTGSPKFVKLSSNNIASNAMAIANYLEISSDDRAFTSLPFNYSYGMSVVNSHLFSGASLLLNDVPITNPAFFSNLSNGRATSFAGVPYSFEVLRIAGEEWASAPALRYISQAGGRLAPDDVRYFANLGRRKGWKFYVMYGQTECSPRIAYLPPAQADEFPDCIGVPIPGGTIEIFGEDGYVIAGADLAGELVYTGPNVMLGYAEDDVGLETGHPPRPHRTGDLACRNGSGLFYIVGRLSRFVKPFGFRVNLDELQIELRRMYPTTICTGSDDLIVIAQPGVHPSADDPVMTWVTTFLKLPKSAFRLVYPMTTPLLANGKPDYQAIIALAEDRSRHRQSVTRNDGKFDKLLSLGFIKAVGIEVLRTIGISRSNWRSVHHIFSTILTPPLITDSTTFVGLSGDSMSYIQVALALEQYLGYLPSDWEKKTVQQLEQEVGVEQQF